MQCLEPGKRCNSPLSSTWQILTAALGRGLLRGQALSLDLQGCTGAQHELQGISCLQTIGVASIPLEEAEFIQFPGRSVPLSVDLMKPEAAGIMKMVGGVGKGVQGVGKGEH